MLGRRNYFMKQTPTLLLLITTLCGTLNAAEPVLALKDNDTWVMAGDSITAQRLHSNYIEAFFRTRYPQWHLHFRNSGIGGNWTRSILDRFGYDVAAWKPNIVSLELGMNDVGGEQPAYIDGMQQLAGRIRDLKAQPIFISSSPMNDGSVIDAWVNERCRKIHPFTEGLVELGRKENILTVDQYHPLINVWGPNKTIQDATDLANRILQYKPDMPLAGQKELRAFASAWKGQPAGISLGGDAVHPGPVGQCCMAAVILKGMHADPEVSSAAIDLKLTGPVVNSRHCKLSDVAFKNGTLSFTRLDERSPWPIAQDAVDALKLMPAAIADLSQYTLKITSLPVGNYTVSMDGTPVGTVSDKQLADGWNMGTILEGPLGAHAKSVLDLVNQLQGKLNEDWRAASKEGNAGKLADAQKAIDECEAQLQTACQPVSIRFEISPAKK
jgi:lysophospholipase L1-like esterase